MDRLTKGYSQIEIVDSYTLTQRLKEGWDIISHYTETFSSGSSPQNCNFSISTPDGKCFSGYITMPIMMGVSSIEKFIMGRNKVQENLYGP